MWTLTWITELNHTEMFLHRHQFKSDSCKKTRGRWPEEQRHTHSERGEDGWAVWLNTVSTVQFSSSTRLSDFIKISELVSYATSLFLKTNKRSRELYASTTHRVQYSCVCYSWKAHTHTFACQCGATCPALFGIAFSSRCQWRVSAMTEACVFL